LVTLCDLESAIEYICVARVLLATDGFVSPCAKLYARIIIGHVHLLEFDVGMLKMVVK